MRLIDADALKEDLLINHNTDLMSQSLVLGSGFDVGVDYVMLFIEGAPTIDLVRCKECKYWHSNTQYCDKFSHSGFIAQRMLPNDFCSLGERKESE